MREIHLTIGVVKNIADLYAEKLRWKLGVSKKRNWRKRKRKKWIRFVVMFCLNLDFTAMSGNIFFVMFLG